MSTIDRESALRIIQKAGAMNPPQTITTRDRGGCRNCGETHILNSTTTYRIAYDARSFAGQIWQYTSGFGSECYKIIYAMYPNRDDDKIASNTFLATGNILPGTTPRCLFRDERLTAAGVEWWQSFSGLPIPDNLRPAS